MKTLMAMAGLFLFGMVAFGEEPKNATPAPIVPIESQPAAVEPLEAKPVVQPVAPLNTLFPETPGAVRPFVTLRHDFGQGVGFNSGFTYLEGFLPVRQNFGSAVTFVNLRVVNYDDARYWENQLGGGFRFLLNDKAILGLNGFYDGRNTQSRYFNQLGVGWELLGARWETRGNVYLPVGTQQGVVADAGTSNPRFVGTNIAIDNNHIVDTAMNGVDFELGRSFQISDRIEQRVFVGGYHYSNSGVQSANGIRGRFETHFGDKLTAYVQVQNDAVFNTTAYAGLGYTFGGTSSKARKDSPFMAKFGQRVVRDPNIVVQRSQQANTQLLTDPATGQPIQVRHAASNAAVGGDGSVERPYQTLAQLQGGSAPNQILFVHGGSVFTGQGIALQPGQRFLAEGITHTVASGQGTFLLPRATGNSVMPVIVGASLNGVLLASNSEVSGFRIVDAGGVAILGNRVNAVNVNRNTIQNAVGGGIVLDNVGGQSYITGNTIDTITRGPLPGPFAVIPDLGAGIYVTSGGTVTQQVDVLNNNISNVDGAARSFGIVLLSADTANVRALVNSNRVSGLMAVDVPFGIASQALDASRMTVQIANNNTLGLTGGLDSIGINVTAVGSSNVGLQLLNNLTATPPRIDLIDASGGTFRVEDTLGTNTPAPSLSGTIVTVPVGTFGFIFP